MSRTVAIIQSRFASQRLPGKALLQAGGRAILEHVIRRVRQARSLDDVVVATGDIPANDPIADLCERLDCACYRGSEQDVLDRYLHAALATQATTVVRITGDCPLIGAEVIDGVVGLLHSDPDLGYASNVENPTWPDGEDCEAASFSALLRAWRYARLPSDREHVTPWLRRPESPIKRAAYWHVPDLSHWRLTVDDAADLQAMRRIMSIAGANCTWRDAVKVMEEHPEITALNQATPRNAGYAKSLRADEGAKHV